MRVLSELIGGIVLLLIFAYGVRETVKFISAKREKNNDNVNGSRPDAAPGNEPL